jgi:hypothetical protein
LNSDVIVNDYNTPVQIEHYILQPRTLGAAALTRDIGTSSLTRLPCTIVARVDLAEFRDSGGF